MPSLWAQVDEHGVPGHDPVALQERSREGLQHDRSSRVYIRCAIFERCVSFPLGAQVDE